MNDRLSRSVRRRVSRIAEVSGVALVGVACGVALAAPVHALSSEGEGPGYGGDTGWLQVTVLGNDVSVRGAGFRAGSDVTVVAGALELSVAADEVGAIDTVILAQPDDGGVALTDVAAVGVAGDGGERELVPDVSGGDDVPVVTTAAAGMVGGLLALGVGGRHVGRRRRTPVAGFWASMST